MSDEQRRESGLPGGGQGRRDEVGGSGVHPASAGNAPDGADVRTPASWGQGERGAEGYHDSGRSELRFSETELRAAEEAETVDLDTSEGTGQGRSADDRTKPGMTGAEGT
jgi:hypothetical protein